jgi:hypothetical protein
VTDRPEPSSPACLAHEADDAYMGYASRPEIVAFLKILTEAEQKGEPVAGMLRAMLPKIRDEALYRELKGKLERIEQE